MGNRMVRMLVLSSSALVSLCCVGAGLAQAPETPPAPQTPEAPQAQPAPSPPGALPTIHVETTKKKPATPAKKQVARRPPPSQIQPTNETPESLAARQLAAQTQTFDTARSNLYTTVGTTSYEISHDTIAALPQGTNTPVERVLLQAPGVSQDSAASGLLHVRNDHANVAFRINGVMLPDGVTGFGSVLETGLIGSLSLVTGALPAEFGMRTVGIVDLTTRSDAFNNSGSISLYGGSRGTFEPSFEYGGTFGGTCGVSQATPGMLVKAAPPPDCFRGVQYFFTGRYLQTTEGIENPLPTLNAIHDSSQQERGFAYMSGFIDPSTRLSLIAGTSIAKFQIPDVPGAPVGQTGNPPVTNVNGITNFDSSQLNENQTEVTHYGVLALQKSANGFDGQLSYFTRYNELHFTPDPVGDLLLNGIASDVTRRSYTNGLQGDGSFQINPANTVRTGFTVSGEQAFVGNSSLVEPCTICDGSDNGAPELITDQSSKLGWLMGVYVQDELKVTDQLTINAGLRFDQMFQYVDANQLSPRISFTYKPFENTTLHAGYARYFTPPVLVEAAPANIHLFDNTTGAPPAGQANDPMQPERSHYFDAGVTQKIPLGCSSPATLMFTKAPMASRDCAKLELGVDAYYKIATDLIDNGNFGQALVLSGFNYAKGVNEGVEFSAKFTSGNFQAYGNLSVAQQKATDPVSNEYLFDNTTPLADLGGLTLFQYLQTHWIYTDHTQIVTASAGLSYLWYGTRFSTDMIYGSGLRNGDANIGTVPAYTQVNAGVSHEFVGYTMMPFTLRFDVVNVFDTIYEIRDGTGIGVFAPQFGPRRGYFAGWTQKL
jgi:outer membrane receptor protein involved in Fe transport